MSNPFKSNRFLFNSPFVWRGFFAICIIALGIQQLIYADFMLVIMPPWPSWLPGRMVLSFIGSALLICLGAGMLFEKTARRAAVLLGILMLLLVVAFHIPFTQDRLNLGSWNNGFKALTLCGGAFIVAVTVPVYTSSTRGILYKLTPLWRFFFSITLIVFGCEHFMYIDFVVTLVPSWIPGHLFWSYFAGVALIAGGTGITLGIVPKLAANLTGVMIFLWFVMLHIPRAIADPHSGNGNEWTSVFESLGFSGIALLIAGTFTERAGKKNTGYSYKKFSAA